MKRLLIALAIVAAGCGQTTGQASPTPSSASTGSQSGSSVDLSAASPIAVTVKDFALDPADVTANGSAVRLAVTNAGPTIHNVTVRDATGAVVMATKNLREGESETITASIPAGTYTLLCTLPGHESLGIKGSLVVAP